MNALRRCAIACCAFSLAAAAATALSQQDKSAVRGKSSGEKTYTLRYKFAPGEVLRWQVQHRAKIRTTLNGTTQTSETSSDSVKVWKVGKQPAEGQFAFIHMVEKVVMRDKTSGRAESVYNSETDKDPPPGFEGAAKNVGVPLAKVLMDDKGAIVRRENVAPQPTDPSSQLTIQLPKDPVAVGEEWTEPHTITCQKKDRTLKEIKCVQRYKLEDVTGHVATIRVETAILTPINDPFIEAQLVQRETQGAVRFDIQRGRIISQELELEKRVIGHIGESSSMHFVMSYKEELLSDETARRPTVGPQR
ncbi:MAG: hypothetical protein HYS13_12200 [Planctomycetia bacterium]|nr:hypothetical protein [Planctomycetia bacterium]